MDGDLDLKQIAKADDATARELLIAVRGIGPWTADIYLLMALRRPDVWPDGDLALIDAVQQIKHLRKPPTTDGLRRIATQWVPWRAVAARICWQYYLSQPK